MNPTENYYATSENKVLVQSLMDFPNIQTPELVNQNNSLNLTKLLKDVLFEALKQSTVNTNGDDSDEPLDLSYKSSQSSVPSEQPHTLHAKLMNIRSDGDDTLPVYHWKSKTFNFQHYFDTFVVRYTANDVCQAHCQYLYKDHFHCQLSGCHRDNDSHVIQGKEKLRLHGHWHEVAREITDIDFIKCVGKYCSASNTEHSKGIKHAHCKYSNCTHVCYLENGDDDIFQMSCLAHIQQNHYKIILKRTNNVLKSSKKSYSNSRYLIEGRKKQKSKVSKTSWPSQSNSTPPPTSSSSSSYSSSSSPNHASSLQVLTPELIAASQYMSNESTYSSDQQCTRLFCNLKRSNHYHCPLCFVGCSKVDLFIRHFRRHKL